MIKLIACKICEGKPHVKCLLCGAVKPKDKEEEARRRAYFRYMRQLWNGLRRAQSAGTGLDDLDREIRAMFGDWIVDNAPVYTSPIKRLYDEAHYQETVAKDVRRAKVAYVRLFQAMKPSDRIHHRITRDDIQRKIAELSRGRRSDSGPQPPKDNRGRLKERG